MSMKEASVYLDVCLERKSDVVFRDWERFLIRFGPFDKCVLKAVQCFQDKLGIAPWFHGVISRAQAEAVTTSSDDGAFLVRFSETQPDKFTLTYMKVHTDPIYNGRKEIKNVLIVHNPREGYGLQDGGNGVKYPSIASFIEGSSVRLRTPIISRLSVECNATLKSIQASSSSMFGSTRSTYANNEYGNLSTNDLIEVVAPPTLVTTGPGSTDYGNLPLAGGKHSRNAAPPPPSNEYSTLMRGDLHPSRTSNPADQSTSTHGGNSFHLVNSMARSGVPPLTVDANRSISQHSPPSSLLSSHPHASSAYGRFIQGNGVTHHSDYGQLGPANTHLGQPSSDYGDVGQPSAMKVLPSTTDAYGRFGPTTLGSFSSSASSLEPPPTSQQAGSSHGDYGAATPPHLPPFTASVNDYGLLGFQENNAYGRFGASSEPPRQLPPSSKYGHFTMDTYGRRAGHGPVEPDAHALPEPQVVRRHSDNTPSSAYGTFASGSLARSTSEYGHFGHASATLSHVPPSSTSLNVDTNGGRQNPLGPANSLPPLLHGKADAVAQIETGMSLYKERKLDDAIGYFLRAEYCAKEAGEKTVEARALGNLGTVYLDKKLPKDAVRYYVKCLALTRNVEDKKRERIILNNLVLASIASGDTTSALQYSTELLTITAVAANRLKIESRIRTLQDELRRAGEIATLKGLGREVCTIVAYAARRTDKSTVRWTSVKPTSTTDPVDLYVGECPVNDTLTFMCGVTRVRGVSVEQIASLLNAHADHAPAFHAAFYGDLIHYEKLVSIRAQSKQFPRHAISVKSATMPSPSRSVAPRDFVYLETSLSEHVPCLPPGSSCDKPHPWFIQAQEDIMDTTRMTRGWVCAMHSIDYAPLSSHRPFPSNHHRSKDIVRGRLFRSGIVVNETKDENNVVEVTYLLQIDFGDVAIPLDVRRLMMAQRLHSLRYLNDHFRNSHDVRRVRSVSSSGSPVELPMRPPPANAADPPTASGHLIPNNHSLVGTSRCCRGCGSKFHLLQRKYPCRGCGDVFCSHCCVHQRLAPGLGGDKISLCHVCVDKAGRTTNQQLHQVAPNRNLLLLENGRRSVVSLPRTTSGSMPRTTSGSMARTSSGMEQRVQENGGGPRPPLSRPAVPRSKAEPQLDDDDDNAIILKNRYALPYHSWGSLEGGAVVNLGDIGNASDALAALASGEPLLAAAHVIAESPVARGPSPRSSAFLEHEADILESLVDNTSEWRGQVEPIRRPRRGSAVVDLRDIKNASELLQKLEHQEAPATSFLDLQRRPFSPPPALAQLAVHPANPPKAADDTPSQRTIEAALMPPLQPNQDAVTFRTFAPPCVSRDATFDLTLWANVVHSRRGEREQQLDDDDDGASSVVPFRRGALVHVSMAAPDGFHIAVANTPDESTDAKTTTTVNTTMTWIGDSSCITFRIQGSSTPDHHPVVKLGQAVFVATLVVGTCVVVVRSFVFITSNRGESFEVAELRREVDVVPVKHRPIPFHDLRLRNLVSHAPSGLSYLADYQRQEVVVRMVRSPLPVADTPPYNNDGNNTNHKGNRVTTPTDFERTAAILTVLGHHPHVESVVGATTDVNEPWAIVSAYTPHACKLDVLLHENHRPPCRNMPATTFLSQIDKDRILCDIALGLLNVHEAGYVLRDISARHCAVDKVTKRAMLTELFPVVPVTNVPSNGRGQESTGRRPGSFEQDSNMAALKYFAPESLQPPHTFTSSSDVYSFGVLMWETYTEARPFGNLTGAEAAAWVVEGGRLDHVSDIPVDHRDLLVQCFQEVPSKRPSAADIVAHFRMGLLANAKTSHWTEIGRGGVDDGHP
ncbi:hypothetical protein DYB36_002965 [Aphanomyces astaci]|uniref:TKL protein kinase n=1 Tax=Aphanomyces astaci TaxID=112090 RepID=A0A396ZXD9_APHAT|nr:hypothetical protein DYB36_002965 [Aphanomyces astaci]